MSLHAADTCRGSRCCGVDSLQLDTVNISVIVACNYPYCVCGYATDCRGYLVTCAQLARQLTLWQRTDNRKANSILQIPGKPVIGYIILIVYKAVNQPLA